MGELSDRLGHKAAGYLIRSSDWNDLLAAMESDQEALGALSGSVDARFGDVDARFAEVNARLTSIDARFGAVDAAIDDVRGALESGMAALRSDVQERIGEVNERIGALETRVAGVERLVGSVLGEYWKLTLKTEQAAFAIGQLAELTAVLTDLRGNPPSFGAGGRPWIDFVTSWGQLKPVPGYASLGGVEDRTLSVQVDALGVAKVILRSDYADGFSDDEEIEVASSLRTNLAPASTSVASAILRAATPVEAQALGAFSALSVEYDRRDAPSLRRYLDAHYVRNPSLTTVAPTFGHRWRDYRATVIAIAKSDSDPLTPDPGRAVSSIQITFRDWIAPWLVLDYMKNVGTLVESARSRLNPKVTGDFSESLRLLKQEVEDSTVDKGLLGRLREYSVLGEAMNEVTGTAAAAPPFLNKLTQTVRDAIAIQHSLEATKASVAGGAAESRAFQVFTNAATRSDADMTEVSVKVGSLQSQFDDLSQTMARRISEQLESRINEFDAPGGALQVLRSSIQHINGQVSELQRIGNVDDVHANLGKITDLSNRLDLFLKGRV